ncbi:MAG: 2-amino-4-hydroxy-6-hydroxymethyldihydropteridine diphosphokinase [Bacteroidaceae bacterium]|nr:2-amino-4-hydroxy-6-hydroxymethyldihydropteridine diphosphokinase [Bacteroidaceae bacterium]
MLYLGLGSNLGNRHANLMQAVALIEEKLGRVVCLSNFYETQPWGYVSAFSFLNAALAVETSLSPYEVLNITQSIERELGRYSKSSHGTYTDRPIDIDLLLMDDQICCTETLTLPHPLMHERLFVMEPLVEIAPTLKHPALGKTILEIYNTLKA